jgi:hypothetical protein
MLALIISDSCFDALEAARYCWCPSATRDRDRSYRVLPMTPMTKALALNVKARRCSSLGASAAEAFLKSQRSTILASLVCSVQRHAL